MRRRRIEAAGENFSLRRVAERDGWVCQICGEVVPDQPYGARDDDPTIDHILPLSRGGRHELANVRLAHNRCNWQRGAPEEVAWDQGVLSLSL